jgi:acyl carrier protein
MERQEVLAVVRAQAQALLDAEPDRVVEDARFGEDLYADSLALLEFAMALEDELGVSLPEDRVAGLETVGELVTLLTDQLAS